VDKENPTEHPGSFIQGSPGGAEASRTSCLETQLEAGHGPLPENVWTGPSVLDRSFLPHLKEVLTHIIGLRQKPTLHIWTKPQKKNRSKHEQEALRNPLRHRLSCAVYDGPTAGAQQQLHRRTRTSAPDSAAHLKEKGHSEDSPHSGSREESKKHL